MYYQLVFPGQNASLTDACLTREAAEARREMHREHGEDPLIEERPGTLVPPAVYGQAPRVEMGNA